MPTLTRLTELFAYNTIRWTYKVQRKQDLYGTGKSALGAREVVFYQKIYYSYTSMKFFYYNSIGDTWRKTD